MCSKTQCITMKATWCAEFLIIIISLLFHKGTCSQSIEAVTALINQPVILSCKTSSCENVVWSMKFPTEATIAKCHTQTCTFEEGFQGKFTNNKEKLVLISAKYSNLGFYECVCDGIKHLVKLDILFALKVTAAESEIITLHCYANNAKDVTWMHDDKRVLHYTISGSRDFESRVSVEEDCFKNADLSLTITGVCKTDAGLYRCFANDEAIKGYPHAYMLYVNGKQSSPGGNHTECNSNVAEDLIIYKWVTVGLVIILALLIVIILYKLYCIKSESQPTSTTDSQPIQEPMYSHRLLACYHHVTSPSADDQSTTQMVTQPVQESQNGITDNNLKLSNTKPF
ncbi:uncharacterized protein LOC127454414 [Myxocyprinus asiaticus]|uniref:uncharacterized protein LOC127454414 n=1 Tax=Myxocyprinus asiaticus TaxID=70543 RepID=UPI0022223959|nr:uncharacterized protein LOC127454414 [Myxocyprinus asiaticus]